jgi:hypothetical protein
VQVDQPQLAEVPQDVVTPAQQHEVRRSGGPAAVVMPLHRREHLPSAIVGPLKKEVPLPQKLLEVRPSDLLELSPGSLHGGSPQPQEPVRFCV